MSNNCLILSAKRYCEPCEKKSSHLEDFSADFNDIKSDLVTEKDKQYLCVLVRNVNERQRKGLGSNYSNYYETSVRYQLHAGCKQTTNEFLEKNDCVRDSSLFRLLCRVLLMLSITARQPFLVKRFSQMALLEK